MSHKSRALEVGPRGSPAVALLPNDVVVIDWDAGRRVNSGRRLERVSVILTADDARQLTSRVLEAQLGGRDYFTKAGITRT